MLLRAGLVLLLVSINSPVEAEPERDSPDEDLKFAVVIDCGSSGTRAHIYSWSTSATGANEQDLSSVTHHTDRRTGKKLIKLIQPGLSSVSDEPDRAGDYLKPIMDFVALSIPHDRHSNTPIYIMATGGMRLLRKDVQDKILNVLSGSIRRDYEFEKIDARVISGADEGINLWLTVNSLSRRLGSAYSGQQPGTLYKRPASSRTLGVLEMGGASAQVVFEVGVELSEYIRRMMVHYPEAYRTLGRSIVDVELGQKRKTKLFSGSFLGLGVNSARSLFTDLLVRRTVGIVDIRTVATKSAPSASRTSQGRSLACAPIDSLRINDPCLPRASIERLEKPVRILYDSSKTLGFESSESFESDPRAINVTFVGYGNLQECLKLMKLMIMRIKIERYRCNDQDPCQQTLLEAPFMPMVLLQYLATGEYYYSSRTLGITDQFRPLDAINRAAQFCATPYERLLDLHPTSDAQDRDRALKGCFKMSWVVGLLHFGLRMPLKSALDFRVANQIDSSPLDWTLGALLAKLWSDDNMTG